MNLKADHWKVYLGMKTLTSWMWAVAETPEGRRSFETAVVKGWGTSWPPSGERPVRMLPLYSLFTSRSSAFSDDPSILSFRNRRNRQVGEVIPLEDDHSTK